LLTTTAGQRLGSPEADAPADPIRVLDPASGELVSNVPVAPASEVRAAVARSRAAATGWARCAPAERAAAVSRAAARVRSDATELARLSTAEMGRPAQLAEGGVEAAAATMVQYAELGPLHRGRALQGRWDATDLMVPEPRGVVALITPWNDPVAVRVADVDDRAARKIAEAGGGPQRVNIQVISPLPGVTATKPGSCTRPLPGIVADIVDEDGNPVTEPGQGGFLVIRSHHGLGRVEEVVHRSALAQELGVHRHAHARGQRAADPLLQGRNHDGLGAPRHHGAAHAHDERFLAVPQGRADFLAHACHVVQIEARVGPAGRAHAHQRDVGTRHRRRRRRLRA